MRRWLLAFSLIVPVTAHAQVLTLDVTQEINSLKEQFNQLKAYAQDLQNYLQYVRTAEEAYSIANGLVHSPNLGSVMALANLGGFDLSSALPVNPYVLMSLTSGYSGAGINGLLGKLTSLGSLATSNYNTNSIHQCTEKNFACSLLTQRAWQNAGTTAAAQTINTDLTNHLQVLTALRTRALASPDQKDQSDLQSQISIETAYIQTTTAQLQAVNTMAQSQSRANDARIDEYMDQSSDTYIKAAMGTKP